MGRGAGQVRFRAARFSSLLRVRSPREERARSFDRPLRPGRTCRGSLPWRRGFGLVHQVPCSCGSAAVGVHAGRGFPRSASQRMPISSGRFRQQSVRFGEGASASSRAIRPPCRWPSLLVTNPVPPRFDRPVPRRSSSSATKPSRAAPAHEGQLLPANPRVETLQNPFRRVTPETA